MGKHILVDPSRLEATSKRINEKASDYNQHYTNLYSEVHAMKSAWAGKDNVAYAEAIESFKKDLDEMKKLLDQYAKFLEHSATQYKKAQEQVMSAASRLSAGK